MDTRSGSSRKRLSSSADEDSGTRYASVKAQLKLLLTDQVGHEALSELLQEQSLHGAAKFDPQEEIKEPSALCRYSRWSQYQYNPQKKPRWKCYRGPEQAEPHVPLVLLNESFDQFCQRSRSHSTSVGLDEADFSLARIIWDTFTRGCSDEKTQLTVPLNDAFRNYLLRPIATETRTGDRTDGLLVWENVEGIAGAEDKRDRSDALFQLLEYLRRAFRANVDRGRRRISHAVGVLRTLPDIQFIAIAMDWNSNDPSDKEGTLMAEPLTDPISCWGPRNTGLVKLASALKAFKAFVRDYKPLEFIDVSIPYALQDWSDVKRISQQPCQDSMVFLGKDATGCTLVAKLTTTYSEDAHNAWTASGLAPKLHEVRQFHSGWKLVIMDYLSKEDGWVSAQDLVKSSKIDAEQLRGAMMQALRQGHETGFVHGDFRLPNIFVREMVDPGFEVRVIDFDWAGRPGFAVYPESLNPKHDWHRDAGVGKLIQPEHDFVFVSRVGMT